MNPLIDHELTMSMSVDCGRKFTASTGHSYEESRRGLGLPTYLPTAPFQCLTMDRLVKCQEQMDVVTRRRRSRSHWNCSRGKWSKREAEIEIWSDFVSGSILAYCGKH